MHPLAYLALMLCLAVLSVSCEIAERLRPGDRTLIWLAGGFAALALVAFGVWVYVVI